MANDLGTGARAAAANAIAARIGAGGKLQIRTGAKPATPETADSGTLLIEVALPNPCFATSTDGVLAKTGTWPVTAAAASGDAGHFRIKTSGGEVVAQGTVSQWAAGGGTGDLKLND